MAARLPIRLLSRHLRPQCSRRAFSSTPAFLEAQNFTMPAMSPTMTEGNISSWKVKEGDTFETGDILLEIETDKASMDVEAQDDGKMAKIFVADGAKGVQVGTRIAVLADVDDDLSILEIPADESKPVEKPAQTEKKAEEAQKTPEPKKAEAPKPSKSSSPKGSSQNPKYPLYPSVIALIHQNHIPDADVAKIPATGPSNRLLKGDVLSYIGSIAADYSATQSKRIAHMAHLDLSDIKVATAPPPSKPAAVITEAETAPTSTTVSLPISLAEVLKVQKRIQDTLGVSMPLSTFLARAVDIANNNLPLPKDTQQSSDALFNAVLGLDSVPATTSRGMYIPQINAFPTTSAARATPRRVAKPDIIEILSGRVPTPKKAPAVGLGIGTLGATNLFTVVVPVTEEKRARTFLERMKTVLQVEPGKLVL